MNIKLGDLKIGQWRDLTVKELRDLSELIKDSNKIYEE